MAQNSKGAYLNVLQDADGKDVYPITRADGVYLNDGTTAQAKCEALDTKIDSTKSTLEQNFQAGVDGIYNAITAQGTTPASKSQGDVKNAIGTLATNKYNQGVSDGKASVTVSASASGRTVTATASNGKTASASVALAGSNGVVSVSTAGGSGNQSFNITDGWCTSINVDRSGAYNKGVSDADNRANSNSTNYKSGYNAGYSAGQGSLKYKDLNGNWVLQTNMSRTMVYLSLDAGVSIVGASLMSAYFGSQTRGQGHSDYTIGWSGSTVQIGLNTNPPSGDEASFMKVFSVRVWYWG